MRGARTWLWLLCWALSSHAWAVRAEEAAEPEAYRATVEEALTEYAAKNYEEASALFQRAHALFPNARTLRGLGMAAFELRRYEESIRHLSAALESDVRPLDQALRADTEALRSRARAFVAQVTLRVDPESAVLSLDGERVHNPAPMPLLLPLGQHVIAAEASGHAPARRKLRVRGGETLELQLKLEPQALAVRSHESEHGRRAYKSPWLWSAVGAVVVGAAVAALLIATRDRTKTEYVAASAPNIPADFPPLSALGGRR